jgi:hypothetical protein
MVVKTVVQAMGIAFAWVAIVAVQVSHWPRGSWKAL